MERKTKEINCPSEAMTTVEGALLAALTVALALIGVYLPLLNFIMSFVWPVPLVVAVVRYGFKRGLLVTATAGILLFLFMNPLGAVFLLLQGGVLALLYGYCIRYGVAAGRTILYGAGAAALSQLIILGLGFLITGIDPRAVFNEMQQAIEPTIDLYRNFGLIGAGLTEEMLRTALEDALSFMVALLPGIFVLGAIFAAGLNYLVVRLVLQRLGIVVDRFPPFREWRLPWGFVWGIISGLVLVLAGDQYGQEVLKLIGQNIIYVYLPILLVIGLAVIIYFYQQWTLPRFTKYILLFLAIFNLPIALVIVLSIGMFDLVIDYRRLFGRKEKSEEQ